MRIGLRLLLVFFLVLGLSLFVVLRVFIEEVKPGTRRMVTAELLAPAAGGAAPEVKATATFVASPGQKASHHALAR